MAPPGTDLQSLWNHSSSVLRTGKKLQRRRGKRVRMKKTDQLDVFYRVAGVFF